MVDFSLKYGASQISENATVLAIDFIENANDDYVMSEMNRNDCRFEIGASIAVLKTENPLRFAIFRMDTVQRPLVLMGTAAEIWELLTSSQTRDDIAVFLWERYSLELSTAHQEIENFVSPLIIAGYLVVSD